MVSRVRAAVLFASILALAACRNEQQEREQVREAILARLQNSAGLDLRTLDVNTTSVTFNKNLAYATVAFHPKDDSRIGNGMTMKYTLEQRNGKWSVVGVADSQGHGLAGHSRADGGSQLPPGHPSIDETGSSDGTSPGQRPNAPR